MTQASRSTGIPTSGAPISEQQPKRRRGRRGGRRGKTAATINRIQATARARQAAWTEGQRPNDTTSLSVDLNGREHVLRPEGLFAEKRYEARSAGDACERGLL